MPFEDHSERRFDKKPLGDRIRDLINPALEDSRRQKIQLDILDKSFSAIADRFAEIMEGGYSDIFNEVAAIKNPAAKNPAILTALTFAPKGQPKYSPILRLPLSISTDFTEFSADEIKELPGYIKLHTAARLQNVALKVNGLLSDEKGHQTYLTIDGSKTYNQGAMENTNLYPNLPSQEVPFDPRKPGDHNL